MFFYEGYLKVYSPQAQRLFKDRRFLKRLDMTVKVDCTKDVPYLAGYSKDGRTVYFDKDFKPFWKYKGKTIDTRDYILVHEVSEKALMDLFRLRYQIAHHLATHFEAETVKDAGIDWRNYSRFLAPQIKDIYHQAIQKIPKDLDLEPYADEHDRAILVALQGGKDIRTKTTGTRKARRH